MFIYNMLIKKYYFFNGVTVFLKLCPAKEISYRVTMLKNKKASMSVFGVVTSNEALHRSGQTDNFVAPFLLKIKVRRKRKSKSLFFGEEATLKN